MRKIIVGTILLLFMGGIFYIYNPENCTLFPRCPFLVLTGRECPGCGSQRALHCLLHFNLTGAFRHNAMLVLSLPIVFLLLLAELMRKSHPTFYSRIQKPSYILTYFTLTILWMVLRNVFGW